MTGKHEDSFKCEDPQDDSFQLYCKRYKNTGSKKILVLELNIIKKLREQYLNDSDGGECLCKSTLDVVEEEEAESTT
jgi:hypothetical protein